MLRTHDIDLRAEGLGNDLVLVALETFDHNLREGKSRLAI